MKNYRHALLGLALLFVVLPGVKAQDLISTDGLVKIMNDPDVRIVSTRKPADYEKVHILDAINLFFPEMNGKLAMLLPPDEIAGMLGAKGISDSQTIVLYDNGNATYAARVYWTLKYLGAKDVKILNGGMPAWKAERKPVSRTIPSPQPVTFNVNLHPEYLATMAEVQKAINDQSYVIVDARSDAEYKGTRTDPALKRLGHIPSAVHLNFTNLLNDGKLKSNEELQALFEEHGITKDKTVIVYCKTSVRAGVVFHALVSALDYPSVKVYDGAFLEWQQYPANRVEK